MLKDNRIVENKKTKIYLKMSKIFFENFRA